MEVPGSVGFGEATEHGPKPYFWLSARGREPVTGVHGAFVLDPDGNNVEAVCHRAA